MKKNISSMGIELIFDEELEGVLVKSGDKTIDFLPAKNNKEAKEAIRKFKNSIETFEVQD